MSERRYDEDEVAEISARATDASPGAPAAEGPQAGPAPGELLEP